MKNLRIPYIMISKIVALYSILLWTFISACNTYKDDCVYYSGELLRNYNWKLLIREVDTSTGAILLIEDKVKDSTHFGSYSFYSDGSLESYKFFGNSQGGYSYNEERDHLGNVVRQEGTPLVYTVVNDVSEDSIYVKYYFSSIKRKYGELYGAINTSDKIELDLFEDSTYSNMKVASVGYRVNNLDTIKVYLTTEYINDCGDESVVLSDTIKLLLRNSKHEFWD